MPSQVNSQSNHSDIIVTDKISSWQEICNSGELNDCFHAFQELSLRLPNPDEVSFTLIDEDESPTRVTTQAHGTPGTPLLIDAKGLLFGCQKRLCSLGSYSSTPKITNGAILNGVKDSAIVKINKIRYAITSFDKRLVLVKI